MMIVNRILVEGMERLLDTFADWHHGVVGDTLRIGAGQTSAAYLLPRYLERFRERYPGISIEMRTGSGRQRLKWLRDYELDLVVGAMDAPPHDIDFRPILRSEYVLVTAMDHLDMTPAAVSIQVRELEYELEAVVFDRNGSRISLTEAGETFYGLAMPLVQGVEGLAENFIERIDDDISGRLDVAASVAGATIVLPPYVKRLRDLYPRVRLWVRNCPLDEGLKLLLAYEVEFVLGGQHSSAPEAVEYCEILSYDIVLITSLDHPLAGREAVTPEDAARWPAIVPPTGTSSLRFGNAVARQFGVDINALMEVGG